MNRYKTLWCPYGTTHDWHECLYAHTYQDWRRDPAVGYTSEPCREWKEKEKHNTDYRTPRGCPNGPLCSRAHGSKEQLYHPAYYKTRQCVDETKQKKKKKKKKKKSTLR
eukprot:Selendium_serpulae@DN475_c0_g1_i2.p4